MISHARTLFCALQLIDGSDNNHDCARQHCVVAFVTSVRIGRKVFVRALEVSFSKDLAVAVMHDLA